MSKVFFEMKNIVTLILAVLPLVCCTDKKEALVIEPNIVLIMADDLGYGDLSSYGNTAIHTPNIDFLAAEGVKFTDYHSNGSVCSPTRAALMTGKYQQRTGVAGVVTAKSHRHVGLSLKEITIADELKKYGYNCGIYGKWHLGYSNEFNPIHQGFDAYTGFVSGNVDFHAHIDQEGYLDWWKGTSIANEEGYTTDLITDYSVKYIQEQNPKKTHKPFFLYVPHEAPHSPYQRRMDKVLREVGKAGTIQVQKDSIPSIYKEMIEVMDEGVGKIIEALKETGQYENTLIIFLSDNGANHNGDNGVLRGFKGGAYEGGSRVPGIMTYPNKIKKGIVNEQTILSMDMLPTILDFVGQKPSAEVDGISIRKSLVQAIDLPKRDVFYAYKNKSFIRSGKWKMLRIEKEDSTHFELFDMLVDLSEQIDVGPEHPILMDSLKEKLEHWEKEVWDGVAPVSN